MQHDATKRERYDMRKIREHESARTMEERRYHRIGNWNGVLADEAIGTPIPGRLIALAKMSEQEDVLSKKTL
jgi:hypothetical protein